MEIMAKGILWGLRGGGGGKRGGGVGMVVFQSHRRRRRGRMEGGERKGEFPFSFSWGEGMDSVWENSKIKFCIANEGRGRGWREHTMISTNLLQLNAQLYVLYMCTGFSAWDSRAGKFLAEIRKIL